MKASRCKFSLQLMASACTIESTLFAIVTKGSDIAAAKPHFIASVALAKDPLRRDLISTIIPASNHIRRSNDAGVLGSKQVIRQDWVLSFRLAVRVVEERPIPETAGTDVLTTYCASNMR
eukprot:TRINITY_DN36726_c0_g1_i1.p2 TRINITY_DN36726_c0_g1~~TRINITY_DN36726_c0_g1_i1.p2  ORF type:complete len:120 (+),score=14.59 TRINITY_DN36726_c0_g1_i1:325-684(+)